MFFRSLAILKILFFHRDFLKQLNRIKVRWQKKSLYEKKDLQKVFPIKAIILQM
jgi:hypothetical protein